MSSKGKGSERVGLEAGAFLNGFIHLMLTQLSTRILTFILNVLITWRLSQSDLGVQVQHQLLLTTILFVSREGFRRGCFRHAPSGEGAGDVPKVVNEAWLSVLLATFMAAGSFAIVFHRQAVQLHNPYMHATILHCVAAVVEMVSEPLYIMAQSLLLVRLRVAAEGSSTLVRCALIYALVVANVGKEGGVVFGYGQLAYSVCLVIFYWGYFIFIHNPTVPARGLLPSRKEGKPWMDVPLLRLCGVFTFQSVQKLVLQKGETVVLLLFDTQSQDQQLRRQGVYSLVENLGSLVVRILFQPLEETVFTLFAKSSPMSSDASAGKLERRKRQELEKLLLMALKLVNYVGLVFVAFGPSYSYVLLRLLYGKRWSNSETDPSRDSEAPFALACYCVYVLVMGINGVTEAFLHAAVTESELRSSNVWLMLFSPLYLVSATVLMRVVGAAGLILANCLNMSMRIAYSLRFILTHLKDSATFNLRISIPATPALLALGLSALITRQSEERLLDRGAHFYVSAVKHIGVGAVCGISFLAVTYKYEREYFRNLTRLRRGDGPREEEKGRHED